jgi:hypothetical protein
VVSSLREDGSWSRTTASPSTFCATPAHLSYPHHPLNKPIYAVQIGDIFPTVHAHPSKRGLGREALITSHFRAWCIAAVW